MLIDDQIRNKKINNLRKIYCKTFYAMRILVARNFASSTALLTAMTALLDAPMPPPTLKWSTNTGRRVKVVKLNLAVAIS